MRWLALIAILGGCDVIWRLDHVPEPPDAPPLIGRWAHVDGGYGATCALDDDQHLWCWGSNLNGELGLASSAPENTVVQQVGDQTWSSVSISYVHTCGLQTNGTLWCWGWNYYGQLGTDSMTMARAPEQVGTAAWLEVSAGPYHTCGIRDDGSAWCWGRGDYGQLGDGTMANAKVPVQVAALGPFSHISPGWTSTCAIAADQTLWCWGFNMYGEFGNGMSTPTPQTTPLQIGSEQWRTLSLGKAYGCAITMTKRLRCWGFNQLGTLGDGTLVSQLSPVAVLVDGVDRSDWRDVTASEDHTCALTEDGHLFCWGTSERGHIGLDGTYAMPSPHEIVGPQPFIAIGTGDASTCAIAADHTMYCVGADGYGELGDGGTSTRQPKQVADDVIAVSASGVHTCMIDIQGNARCAGSNGAGELGTGDNDGRAGFVGMLGAGWAAIDTGATHTCAVSAASVLCWGSNVYGELGNNSSTPSASPVQVRTGAKVAAGGSQSCTIDTGTALAYCWGANDHGQLGNNATATAQRTPVQVTNTGFIALAAGDDHTCGIAINSFYALCWGLGSSGQLGTGNTNNEQQPVVVQPVTQAAQITAGGSHSCLVRADNSAACWGANQTGQLGVGDTSNRSSATAVPGMWLSLSAGFLHTCGIKIDGSLWCWGLNARGQLGDGTLSDRTKPVQVGVDQNWTRVSAGSGHTCATKANQSLWCWGDNGYGQLATGDAWRIGLVQVP